MSDTDYISVGFPTRLFTELKEGRVDPFRLRQIDVDYRALVLAERPNAEAFLAARSYLAQVEIGAAALRTAQMELAATGVTHEYLASMQETAEGAHKATLHEMQRIHITLDQRLLDVTGAVFAGYSQVSSSIDNMTEDLAAAILSSADYAADAVYDVGNLLHADLIALLELTKKQTDVLLAIHRTLLHPMDTRVQEVHQRAMKLLRLGFTSRHGKWRYDNWRQALSLLKEVLVDPVGSTNPLVAFDCAYLEWKCSVSLKNQQERMRGLLASKNYFDQAARLSDGDRGMLHLRALRHLAHIHYELGDFKSAKQTIQQTGRVEKDADIAFEFARYAMRAGGKGTALHALETAIELRPSITVAMFAEPDFKMLYSDMAALLHRKTTEVKERVKTRVDTLLLRIPESPEKAVADVSCLGSLSQHKDLMRVLEEFQKSHDYFVVEELARVLGRIESRISKTKMPPLEIVRLLAFHGKSDAAMDVLSLMLKRFPNCILEVEQCKDLPLYPRLTSELDEMRKQKREELALLLHNSKSFVDFALLVFRHVELQAGVSPAFAELIKHDVNTVSSYSYTDLHRITLKLKEERETFLYTFIRQREEGKQEFPSGMFSFKGTKPSELTLQRFSYVILALSMCIVRTDASYATEDMVFLESLRSARERYQKNPKEAALTKIEENGLGEYWRFSFPLLFGEGMGRTASLIYFVKFKETKLFRKSVGFEVGDTITYTMLREPLSELVSASFRNFVLETSFDPL